MAPDLTMVREDVKRRFDAEAMEAARAAERDRAVDASGARIDTQALVRPGTGDPVVASVGTWTLGRQEFQWLRDGYGGPQAQHPPLDFARWLVVNHVLAERRRGEPIDADLQKKLDDARFNGIVDVRKRELVAAIAKEVSATEMTEFYEKYRDKAPLLRDHVIDLLSSRRRGPTRRRSTPGRGHLQEAAGRPELRPRPRGRGPEAGRAGAPAPERGDVPSLRAQSLASEDDRPLPVGEVSVPIYMEGEPCGSPARRAHHPPRGWPSRAWGGACAAWTRCGRACASIQHTRQSEGVAAIFKRLDDQPRSRSWWRTLSGADGPRPRARLSPSFARA